jgi:hypothetical protein
MSQSLRVAGFELIISGRFWVIAKARSAVRPLERMEAQPLDHANRGT